MMDMCTFIFGTLKKNKNPSGWPRTNSASYAKKHHDCCITLSGLSNRQKLKKTEVKRGKRVTTKRSHRKWQLPNHLPLRQIQMKTWLPLRRAMTMSKRWNWCGQYVALLPHRRYCKNCYKSAYRICPRYHKKIRRLYIYVALQLPVRSKSTFFYPALILILKYWATLHLCSGLHTMNILTMCHPTLVYVPPLVFGSSE